ncbi:MAG: UDP-N-acetylmuramoyl-L-alanyl-D-glutamate--2,6-diaminopimelate ligase [Burkholderiales bacterium]
MVAQPIVDVPALLARLGAFPRRLTTDSRRVEPGVAFAAYPGTVADGRRFVPDAIARGASAVLWESRDFVWDPAWAVPNAGVEGLQQQLGYVASFMYGGASRKLWMAGVTGTNGKTSCAQWIAQALDACGRRAAVLGTLGNGLVGALAPATHTTPDAAVLHELLAQFHAAGARAVAMEVSSHGLDQGRVNGAKFDIALFTNLTRDHLDYHKTMAAYGAAKAKLFTWPGLRAAVITADDPFGQSLIEAGRARGQRLLSYGLGTADIAGTAVAVDRAGIVLDVNTPGPRDAPVAGGRLVQRAQPAGRARRAARERRAARRRGRRAREAGGAGRRMERFGGERAPLVVVDYAHTPDALEKALSSLRGAVALGSELICVFGCGGDRDPGKRPQMGAIAARLADRVVVTSDNPRSEDPAAIAQAVAKGILETGARRWSIEVDRRAAIRGAIAAAREGDVVLVAGKGHETYQEAHGERRPFSDALETRAALAAWKAHA